MHIIFKTILSRFGKSKLESKFTVCTFALICLTQVRNSYTPRNPPDNKYTGKPQALCTFSRL